MENCLVTKLKGVVDNDNLNYLNAIAFNVLDSEKAIAGCSQFYFYPPSSVSLVGCTVSSNKLASITKPKINIIGKDQILGISCTFDVSGGVYKNALELDLDTCKNMTALNGGVVLLYVKLKGDITSAFLGGSVNTISLGQCDYSDVTTEFDSQGMVFGNYFADNTFRNLTQINIQSATTPVLELLPFINACRGRERFPSAYNEGLSLLYSDLSKIKINGSTAQSISSSARYISWTSNTVLIYNSSGTLLSTINV